MELRGMVKDSNGVAITKATVQLFAGIDTSSTLSGEDGSFHFRIPMVRSFELLITMEGYSPFQKAWRSNQGTRLLILPPILLQTTYGELAPVVVQKVKPFTIRQDTIDYHARAFKIRPGSELESLLKKLPGLEIDMDGTITVQGKKIGRVMVDGRDFPGDVLTAIRNLPANIVDIIQVIDDYGDKARLTGVKSGESDKVLNVILKKDKKNGQFGQLQLAIGNKDKYNSTLFSDAIKDDRQLTLNAWLRNLSPTGNTYEKGVYLGYSDRWSKKWSGNTNASLYGDRHSIGTSQIQDNFFTGSNSHLEQSNLSSGSKQAFDIGYTLKYNPDPNTILRFNPSLNIPGIQEENTNKFSNTTKDSGFSKATTGQSVNRSNTHTLSAGSDIYFEKLLPHSNNRFSMQVSYHYSDRKQNADNLTNTSIQADSQSYFSQQHYLLQTQNTSRDLATSLNYYISFGKMGFVELGYSWHSVSTQNSLFTRTPDTTTASPVIIDSLSNDYHFQTITQRVHTGYIIHSNKLNLMLSIDAQPLVQHGQSVGKGVIQEYHYFNFLPMTQLSYSFSPEMKLNFEYGGNSSPPQLRQLQPVTDLSNPQYPVTGNPDLKSSFSHGLKLHYEQFSVRPTWLQSFEVELSYYATKNMIIPNIVHSHDTSSVVQRTTYENANGFYSFSASYHLNFPAVFHKHLRISIIGNLDKHRTPSLTDNVFYSSSNLNWGQGLSFNLDIPDIMESELSGNYTNILSKYASGVSPYSSSYASWGVNNRHFILKKWILEYSLSQFLVSGIGNRLGSNPAILNASLQRQFFKNNQVTFSLSAFDIFNGNTGVTQMSTATSVTQNRTTLLGRYFTLSVQLKLQKFHQ